MRNLKNVHWSTHTVGADQQLTASTWDVSSESIICTFGPKKENPIVQLSRLRYRTAQTSDSPNEHSLTSIASWDAPCPNPDLPSDTIVSLQYFPDSQSVCVVFEGGDVVVVRENPHSSQDKIEIVGSIDAGINAARWSPDEDLLAISTKADTLLYMTRQYECIVDISLSTEDFKASNHVSVGWGKRETQFKGKRARVLQDPTVPEYVDEGTKSSVDNGRAVLSWRGDGAFVALSTLSIERGRVVRVYSRDGIFDSVSQPVDEQESALSWRPQGNLIASIQRTSEATKVIFFERNGLRHGEFSLRRNGEDSATSPVSLEWNADSSILAVFGERKVQLWTMGNHHYYLKQEILFDSSIRSLRWHPDDPLHFAIMQDELIQRFRYVSVVDQGPCYTPFDYGLTAVIDGNAIKITPLRLANIPPPMSWREIQHDRTVMAVAVSRSSNRIAVLDRESVTIYQIDLGKKQAQYILDKRCTLEASGNQQYTRQITFLDDDAVFVLASSANESSIHRFSLEEDKAREKPKFDSEPGSEHGSGLYSLVCHSTSDLITHLFTSFDQGQIGIRSEKGQIYMSRAGGTKPLWSTTGHLLPHSVSDMQCASYNEKDIIFSLSSSGTLYANQRLLARNCSSFLMTTSFLLYTTSQNTLKFVHLFGSNSTGEVDELVVPPDEPEKDERCRAIERGAKLVTIMPSSFAVILQMPRGNLETIYPRALVLAGIRRSIEKKEYKAAFLACRSQRVDMNFLHDHAPELFMANVALFIDQIQKVEHIDLFLSQLRDEDVSVTMYRETLLEPKQQDAKGGELTSEPSKTNRICDAFLKELDSRRDSNMQNLITAHVCKSPPDLEVGLRAVGELKNNSSDLGDAAVEHICFLADVNKLYNSALGLYDLSLALLIAQQSQMDPREYLPFLQKIQQMPDKRRQFFIDDHLKRHDKALEHLKSLDSFDELKRYTQKHVLYARALGIFRYEPDKVREITALYADYLNSKSNFRDAGIAYESLQDYAKATEAYRAANAWREALYCASLAQTSSSQLKEMAISLADSQYEMKNYFDAATIHRDYLGDIETAAKVYGKGYFFAEAMRMIELHQRRELLADVVDATLREGLASSTELLAECKGQINAQVPRLRELRLKKKENPMDFYDGPINDTADIPDNISLAASNMSTSASLFTRYTARNSGSSLHTHTTRQTSKNRKREERKRARGKKGSVYEEEYLVNSVGRLVERVNSVAGGEVERLVEGLVRRGMLEEARGVGGAMAEVVGLCRGFVEEVFGGDGGQHEEGKRGDGVSVDIGAVSAADKVFLESLEEGRVKREVPVVKKFRGLAILER